MKVVDYFAGLGGFTLGATQARAEVVAALNHWRAAMGFPEHYQLPPKREDATKMLGNAIVPAVAASAVRAVMEAA